MYIYRVIDTQTGKTMGIYKSLRRANRKVDLLDTLYGDYRYTVNRKEITMQTFLDSYIATAIWSSLDDAGIPLDDAKYADVELSAATRAAMSADCAAFLERATPIIQGFPAEYPDSQLGHDFWLTRNRHGSGFWDGDYPKLLGEKLTVTAYSFGECNLYVENGLIEIL